ncbi:ubiquinol-cytochrome c reductase iron-sulfur subunit [Pokkaliibacter sp. CJK22405]|uniref:ubiquinol-cytochrome c reductase iron-sulfur subunit n=1 Tax=Pokkaliibacter sp. CJK22405 TaxID=3384615 RepID=UPI0039848217
MKEEAGLPNPRRRFLLGSTLVLGAAAVVGAAVPLVCALRPVKGVAETKPIVIDLSKLESGQQLVVNWADSPVWVIRRTASMLAEQEKLTSFLADPWSANSTQPAYIPASAARSVRDDVVVVSGVCTHLGCLPRFQALAQPLPPSVGAGQWCGGFICPCHGSLFDFSGRVYRDMPAPTNLVVPPYFFRGHDQLVIGRSGEGVA